MNAPDPAPRIAHEPDEPGRLDVLQRFKVEVIQHLGRDDLLSAQSLLGHGELWGRWQTPKSLASGSLKRCVRVLDLDGLLRNYLAKDSPPSASSVDQLVEEGVLVLTRLALLMRLIPSGGTGHGKPRRLKSSSITTYLYRSWPRITARAIRRKAEGSAAVGLFRCLTEADLQEFKAYEGTRIELDRLGTLVARGVWSDAPPLANVRQTTDPSQQPSSPPPQHKPESFLPLPDDWLAEIGPRVLWIIRDLGPNLLRLLEAMPQELKSINSALSQTTISRHVARRIQEHLRRLPWLDRTGQPLSPPFPMTTSHNKWGRDRFAWPPRGWEHVVNLSLTLQAAHLFIALLTSAGRLGEVATLARGCVEVGRDGKDYLKGFTYKLSGNLFGDARQWPAPAILCQCLGQQVRLAAAMGWLPGRLDDGLPQTPRFGDALWVSIGTSGTTGEDAELNINQTLHYFAQRLGMDPKPGGVNVHAHRFRKTIGRLAGIALWHSPLLLKRLFGHKSIEMTLHYILCDPAVREVAEKVLRELRIMHCAEALEEIHQALRDGLPLPGNGGPGAARLVTTVRNEEDHLKQSGRVWDDGSAYDLAYLITAQGQGWRLIQENIACSKAPGEDGLCQKKRSKGEPNTANCQPECGNRIVLMRRRRDSEQVIKQYLDIARQARDDGQLLVLAGVVGNVRDELEDFADLKERYLADPEVQSLFALCEETEAEDAA